MSGETRPTVRSQAISAGASGWCVGTGAGVSLGRAAHGRRVWPSRPARGRPGRRRIKTGKAVWVCHPPAVMSGETRPTVRSQAISAGASGWCVGTGAGVSLGRAAHGRRVWLPASRAQVPSGLHQESDGSRGTPRCRACASLPARSAAGRPCAGDCVWGSGDETAGASTVRTARNAHALPAPRAQALISVPMPLSVNSSSSTECSTRPSMMWAVRTPVFTASSAHSIFGSMPP